MRKRRHRWVILLLALAACGRDSAAPELSTGNEANVVRAKQELAELAEQKATKSDIEQVAANARHVELQRKRDRSLDDKTAIEDAVRRAQELINEAETEYGADSSEVIDAQDVITDIEADLDAVDSELASLDDALDRSEMNRKDAADSAEQDSESAESARKASDESEDEYEERCGAEPTPTTTTQPENRPPCGDDGTAIQVPQLDTMARLCGIIGGGQPGPATRPTRLHVASFGVGGNFSGLLGGCGGGSGPSSHDELLAALGEIPGALVVPVDDQVVTFVLPASELTDQILVQLSDAADGSIQDVDQIELVDATITPRAYLAARPNAALDRLDPGSVRNFDDLVATLPADVIFNSGPDVVGELSAEQLPNATIDQLKRLDTVTLQALPTDFLLDMGVIDQLDLTIRLSERQLAVILDEFPGALDLSLGQG